MSGEKIARSRQRRGIALQRETSVCAAFPAPHSPLPTPRPKGFTMIELIVVIVLIGIVASVVTFSFTRTLAGARIQAASNDLVAGLRYTRGQAIVKGEQKVLLLDLEKNTWLAPGKEERKLPEGMILRLTTAQQELTSDKAGGIRFFPDGSSTGGNIAVVLGDREWKINVGWLTGEVTLDKPDNEK
ncbi:MAG TPA: GspH/FimT family pseudopilin [Dokdonella sp.]|uniref:GspH/FimT family pseudopilin n=1 Tax=Dokdonella sp. TaxID=2291710 RepID=UPI002D7E75B9|nr:GspH/FimT family pseudopilin [Dokdonella sp.]HET9032431.1 GspH/FimT family pseudopilin [Dokdonella sp.]